MLLLTDDGTFLVAPGAGLMLWTVFALALLVCGGIAAAKGRWWWVLAGILIPFVMLAWPFIAYQPALPGSFWSKQSQRRRASAQR